ncbi:hypothetical protein P43SY_003226 [Pythium insidiosum]|uniref:Tetraspanin family protein n=1 Tax=Pythium insidiosum TaxID=114742 RepID=A0AAD5LKS3_PYTIN|nr:hypothetical protein P43SY_003226 [Pythium insidiosum]
MQTTKCCSALILIAMNLLLLGGGFVVLLISASVRASGWIEVLETHWPSANGVLLVLNIVGGIIIALAVLGSISALCRWRIGLLLYAILVLIMVIVFAVTAFVGFSVHASVMDWKSKPYPAFDDEPAVKREFDRAYCYAQGAHVCNDMTVNEAAKTFLPEVNATFLKQFDNVKGVNALCDTFGSAVPDLQPLCQGCAIAKDFKNFSSILEWANDECPRTRETMVWCGVFLATKDATELPQDSAPYAQCRPDFLRVLDAWVVYIASGALVVCIGGVLVIGFSCFLRRRERQAESMERLPYATPHASDQAYYGNDNAATRPPIVGNKV